MDKVIATYDRPDVSVDTVLLTLRDGALHVVLTRRESDPYLGALALPGGYVHTNEDATLAEAARRVLASKAGIRISYLEQLATFGSADRDPRGWSISVVYCALAREADLAGSLKEGSILLPADEVGTLPFDHNTLIAAALRRVRDKSSYSSLPAFLLPKTFTLAELQSVYEQVMGVTLERVTFRRRIEEQGFVKPAEGQFRTGLKQRPAQLYRLKTQALAAFNAAFTGR